MKKYSGLFIIIVGVIILFIVFGGDLSNSDEKNKKLVSSEDNIIGIWKSTKCVDSNKKDNSSVSEAAIQFNEDGSCVFAKVIVSDTSTAKFEQKNDGSCYLNSSKTKLKMEKENNVIINWESFNNSGNTMTIGDCTYSKVS